MAQKEMSLYGSTGPKYGYGLLLFLYGLFVVFRNSYK